MSTTYNNNMHNTSILTYVEYAFSSDNLIIVNYNNYNVSINIAVII